MKEYKNKETAHAFLQIFPPTLFSFLLNIKEFKYIQNYILFFSFFKKHKKEYVEWHITVCKYAYEAALQAHAIVLMTEWPHFKENDYEKIYKSMMNPAFFFDG